MKSKFFFAAVAAIAIAFVFSSCSSKKTVEVPKQFPELYYPGWEKTASDSITYPVFERKTWQGKKCDGSTTTGKYWKPAGTQTKTVSTNYTEQGQRVPYDSLTKLFGSNDTVTYVDRESGSGYSGTPGWLSDLMWFLLFLLGLVALIAFAIFLWGLVMKANRNNAARQSATGASATNNSTNQQQTTGAGQAAGNNAAGGAPLVVNNNGGTNAIHIHLGNGTSQSHQA